MDRDAIGEERGGEKLMPAYCKQRVGTQHCARIVLVDRTPWQRSSCNAWHTALLARAVALKTSSVALASDP